MTNAFNLLKIDSVTKIFAIWFSRFPEQNLKSAILPTRKAL